MSPAPQLPFPLYRPAPRLLKRGAWARFMNWGRGVLASARRFVVIREVAGRYIGLRRAALDDSFLARLASMREAGVASLSGCEVARFCALVARRGVTHPLHDSEILTRHIHARELPSFLRTLNQRTKDPVDALCVSELLMEQLQYPAVEVGGDIVRLQSHSNPLICRFSIPSAQLVVSDAEARKLTATGLNALIKQRALDWVNANFPEVFREVSPSPSNPKQAPQHENQTPH